MAAYETDRATVVALNAEVRRIKARLMDEVPKLKKLALRKVFLFSFLINLSYKKEMNPFCFYLFTTIFCLSL